MGRINTLQGCLLMVQESRFRLAAQNGQVYLFSLSHDASVDEMDLLDYFESESPVIVEYRGEPGFDSGIALGVTPLAADRSRRRSA